MAFLGSGYAKLTEPMHLLIVLLEWPDAADERFVRAMGLVEIVLAAGVWLPLIFWPWGRGLLRGSAWVLAALTLAMAVVHSVDPAPGLALYNIALLGLAGVILRFR